MPESLLPCANSPAADIDVTARVTADSRGRDVQSPYILSHTPLDRADETLVREWQALHDLYSPDVPTTDPERIRGDYLSTEIGSLSVYSIHRAGRLSGVAAVARREWPMKWHLGDLAVATLPLTRLRLLGGTLDLPAEAAAYDLLFEEFSDLVGVDAVHVEEVPVDSFLWKYLHQSEIVRRRFLVYQPDPPLPRLLLRLDGSFEQYLGKFSRKHRVELGRRVRRLSESPLGEMRLVRFESEHAIPEFMEHAQAVSRKTYQWRLHGRGLSDTELVRTRLTQDAARGWLRSYILFLGDRPCAFRAACQYRSTFLSYEIGFDPDLAQYSVGTVLQYLTIQDLFEYHKPAVFDFQDYGIYKEGWATESSLQGKFLLLHPSVYTRLTRSGHRICQSLSKAGASALESLNWKSYVKKRMRNWKKSS